MGNLTDPDLSKHFAWDGDRLITEDQEVVDKLRRTALSPSTAKSMKGCVARWAAEKILSERTVEDPFDPAPLGTSGHALYEEMYAWEPELRSPEAYRKLIMRESKKMEHFKNAADATPAMKQMTAKLRSQWRNEVIRVTDGLWTFEDPSKVKIYGLETHMNNIEIEGVPVNGFIDRISIDEEGNLMPEDYKTGKKKAKSMLAKFGDDHGDQLRIYKVGIETMFDVEVKKANVLYTGVKEKECRPVNLSPRAMKKTLTAFVDGWKMHNQVMEEGSFPTETGPLCGWCPLVNACPAAEAGDRVDAFLAKPEKKPTAAPTKVELGIPVLRKMGQIAVSEGVSQPDSIAHTINEATNHEMETLNMSINEYRFMGAAGLQNASYTMWDKAGVADPTLPQVMAGSRLLRMVVAYVQRDIFGGEDLGARPHTQLRSMLYSALDRVEPFPYESSKEEIADWSAGLRRRVMALATAAVQEVEDVSPVQVNPDEIFSLFFPEEQVEEAEPEPAAEPEPEAALETVEEENLTYDDDDVLVLDAETVPTTDVSFWD